MRISDWSSDVCSSDLMRLTENHIRQLHQTLLRHSDKDERHRGSYKTLSNNVVALDAAGRSEERRVGKECSVRVDIGGRSIIKKKNVKKTSRTTQMNNTLTT